MSIEEKLKKLLSTYKSGGLGFVEVLPSEFIPRVMEILNESDKIIDKEEIQPVNHASIMLINWVRSCSRSGWLKYHECSGRLSLCQSIGFVVEETKELYCLAQNKTNTEGHQRYGDLISIPKVAVIKAVKIKT